MLGDAPVSLDDDDELIPPRRGGNELVPILKVDTIPATVYEGAYRTVYRVVPVPDAIPCESNTHETVVAPVVDDATGTPVEVARPGGPDSSPVAPGVGSFST